MGNADGGSVPSRELASRQLERLKAALDRQIKLFRASDLTLTVNYAGLLELQIQRDIVDAVLKGKPWSGLRRELARVIAATAPDQKLDSIAALLKPPPEPRGRRHEKGLEPALRAFVSGAKPPEVARRYRGKLDVDDNDIRAARRAIDRLLEKVKKELDEKR